MLVVDKRAMSTSVYSRLFWLIYNNYRSLLHITSVNKGSKPLQKITCVCLLTTRKVGKDIRNELPKLIVALVVV